MAVSVVAVGNAAGQSAGTTTTASTVSVTPTLPTGSATGDRIFITVAANNTSGTAPANWTTLFKDTVIGTGAAGAGTGQRYLSVFYRDYDGTWTMPAVTLTSAAQNTQSVGSIALRKASTDLWDAPTSSAAATFYGAAGTAFTTTSGTFTTVANAVLMAVVATNANVTATAGAITGTNGFTAGTVTERVDGGSATGNDASIKLHTAIPSAAGSPAGTLTHTMTLSGASEGGVIYVQQTVTAVGPGPAIESMGALSGDANGYVFSSTVDFPVPPGVSAGDIIICAWFIWTTPVAVTGVPSGFAAAPSAPVTAAGQYQMEIYWKRASGADTGTYQFTLASACNHDMVPALCISNCVASSSPFDVSTSTTGAGVSTVPAVSFTTTVDNTLVLYYGGAFDGATNKAGPTGFTLDWTGINHQIGVSHKAFPTAGATGSLTGLWSPSTTFEKDVWMGALKPPGGAAAPVVASYKYPSIAVHRAHTY